MTDPRSIRKKAMDEAADYIMSQRIAEPDGDCEEHVNWVLESLAAQVRRKAEESK